MRHFTCLFVFHCSSFTHPALVGTSTRKDLLIIVILVRKLGSVKSFFSHFSLLNVCTSTTYGSESSTACCPHRRCSAWRWQYSVLHWESGMPKSGARRLPSTGARASASSTGSGGEWSWALHDELIPIDNTENYV